MSIGVRQLMRQDDECEGFKRDAEQFCKNSNCQPIYLNFAGVEKVSTENVLAYVAQGVVDFRSLYTLQQCLRDFFCLFNGLNS